MTSTKIHFYAQFVKVIITSSINYPNFSQNLRISQLTKWLDFHVWSFWLIDFLINPHKFSLPLTSLFNINLQILSKLFSVFFHLNTNSPFLWTCSVMIHLHACVNSLHRICVLSWRFRFHENISNHKHLEDSIASISYNFVFYFK